MAKNLQLSVLTSYERAIANGDFKRPSIEAAEGRRTRAIADAILSSKCGEQIILDDGTVVEPTIEEVLIGRAIQRELESPKGIETVERLMKIRGELQEGNTTVNVSLVDADLAKRALS